jgi:hypothetical protein
MPEDTTPISSTVPETTTVDTGASPEDIGKLKDSFADFWAEQDADAPKSDAPDAPGPAQETKETKEPPTEPVKAPPTPVTPKEKPSEPEPKDYTDDEIDGMQLIPNQRPEVYEQFKSVKEKWKADRAMLRAEKERSQAIQTQLAEARANQMTPEVKADYEHALTVRRRFDYATDPEFIEKFHKPIYTKYQEILDDAVGMLPDRARAQEWAELMKREYTPDQLSREWWLESLIAKVPNELDRNQLLIQITDLLHKQKDRTTEIARRTNDKSSFENWVQEKTTQTAQRVQEEIMAEIGVQEKRIQEVLPRDVSQAKTKEERAAIEAHNARFQKLNEYFVNNVRDLSANGPRAWVRVAVEATRTKIMDEQIASLEQELKDAKAERDQLRNDLEKINGARRRLSNTTGTPPTSAKPQTNGGLSLKDLDIRKSFRNFDWGDGQ